MTSPPAIHHWKEWIPLLSNILNHTLFDPQESEIWREKRMRRKRGSIFASVCLDEK